jgi:hypothetical protein
MPKAHSWGYSNATAPEGEQEVHYFPPPIEDLSGEISKAEEKQLERAVAADEKDAKEEESSAGTSSSTSGKTPAKSGSSTTTGRQSRAQGAGNPSEPGQPAKQVLASAPSTAGSTRRTGSDRQSPSDSSAESAPQTEATAGQGYSEESPQGGGFLIP